METGDESLDPRELMQLLERQREAYHRLRTLADRQSAVIAHDDPQALLTILADRQKLVDDLGRCHLALARFRRNWPAVMERLDEGLRTRVRGLLEENDRTLASVLDSDKEDAQRLAAKQEGARPLLSAAADKDRASREYAAASRIAPSARTDASG